MKSLLFVLAACASTLSGCQRSTTLTDSTSAEARVLFDKIDALAAKPFLNERVERVTGHRLHVASRIPYYESKDEKNPWFSAVELRGASFLLLHVQPKLCVSFDEVKARYGDRWQLNFPIPHPTREVRHDDKPQHQPPMHYVFSFTWGKASFSFEQRGRECLTEVVLDTFGK